MYLTVHGHGQIMYSNTAMNGIIGKCFNGGAALNYFTMDLAQAPSYSLSKAMVL